MMKIQDCCSARQVYSFAVMGCVVVALVCTLSGAVFATTTIVHVGGNLQSAINAAALGDTIVLDKKSAGDYPAFTLPVKGGCNGSSYINIESEELSSLTSGTRITASQASHMARVVTTSGAGVGAIVADSGAGCYRLRGLEITNDTTVQISSMVDLRATQYIVYDRNLQHPKEWPNTVAPYNTTARIGIALTGANHVQVTNSAFPGYYGIPPGQSAGATASDTNIIVIEAGPTNDILIDNNSGEPWFNFTFVGGSDSGQTSYGTITGSPTVTSATVTGVVGSLPSVGDVIAIQIPYVSGTCKVQNPLTNCYGNGVVSNVTGNTITYSALIGTDAGGANRITIPGGVVPAGVAAWRNAQITNVTISRNNIYFYEPFCVWQMANNGNHPKGSVEIKNANGLDFNGNYIHGFPTVIGIGAANQSGGDPYSSIQNVTVRNNYVVGYYTPFKATLADPYYVSTSGLNISYTNNLFVKALTTEISGLDLLMIEGQNGNNLTFQHNTVLADVYSIRFGVWQQAFSNFQGPTTWTIKDNITPWGNYGWGCDGGGVACVTVTEDQNLFHLNQNPPNEDVAVRFPNSLTAATVDAIKLVNKAACLAGTSIDACALAVDSPGANQATDGGNIGFNPATMKAAMSPSDLAQVIGLGSAVQGRTVFRGKVVFR